MVLQFLGNGLINGSLIALTALGFSLIYNTTRIFHIAYAGIYVWAGYMLYVFVEYLQWPVAVSFVMAMIFAAVISVACEQLVYQPLIKRGRSHNAMMISSIGILVLLVSLSELFFGNAALYIDFSISSAKPGSRMFPSVYRLLSLIISLFIMGAFFLYLKFSPVGIRIRALRDSEQLSRLFGVRTKKLKSLLYILSGLIVASAAGLSALDVGINPHLGIAIFINAFVALVIGGIGRFDGPVIGGILLGLLQSLTEYFFDSRWVMMVTFIVLILFLMLRPQGLIPERSRSF